MRLFGNIFYAYLWIACNSVLFYFYRFKKKKHSVGRETIPNAGPLIICSNHVNAFMDPILIGSAINRRTWFLARSDAFRKKRLARFLTFLGIIPIYRLQEGAENLSKNDETFDKCEKLLRKQKAIIIFSEGLCVQERRLRKLKKGTARIALGTEEKHDFKLGLNILPVGLNYSATPWKFRTGFHFRAGKPFLVKDYEELYRKDKAKAITQFTRDLEARMKAELIVIEHHVNDGLVNELEEMLTVQMTKERGLDPMNHKDTHEITTAIAEKVNRLENEHPEQCKHFRHDVKAYFDLLKKNKLRDWLLNEQDGRKINGISLVFYLLFFITGFPLWVFGVITNYIPYKVPWLVTKKIVKQVEWSASVNGVLGVFLWQFYWLLQSLVVALVFRNWYLLWAFMLLVPISGIHAQAYWVYLRRFAGSLRWWRKPNSFKEDLLRKRKSIIERFFAL